MTKLYCIIKPIYIFKNNEMNSWYIIKASLIKDNKDVIKHDNII